MGIISLLISLLYIGLTVAVSYLSRRILKESYLPIWLLQLLQEIVASAELCACCFELGIIAENFGVPAYAVCLFSLTIWWIFDWGDASACPYSHLEKWYEGKQSLAWSTLTSVVELISGVAIFRYVQFLWNLNLSSTHTGQSTADCTADLQVNAIYGAVVEALGTFICCLSERLLFRHNIPEKISITLVSFISTALVIAAFDLSGGYMNPMLATSLKFGCAGHNALEHIVVYWIGACAGSLGCVYLWKQMSSMFPVKEE